MIGFDYLNKGLNVFHPQRLSVGMISEGKFIPTTGRNSVFQQNLSDGDILEGYCFWMSAAALILLACLSVYSRLPTIHYQSFID